jgi:hypothetical protein|tara:strand:- start:647 stop:997 length:351 start_codon:yes stop_codon:yes gene_type:complete
MAFRRMYLRFTNAADDQIVVPADNFTGMTVTDADEATVSFKAVDNTSDAVHVKIKLGTCLADFKNACRVIASALAGSGKFPGAIVVADDLAATPLIPTKLKGINFDATSAISSIDE